MALPNGHRNGYMDSFTNLAGREDVVRRRREKNDSQETCRFPQQSNATNVANERGNWESQPQRNTNGLINKAPSLELSVPVDLERLSSGHGSTVQELDLGKGADNVPRTERGFEGNDEKLDPDVHMVHNSDDIVDPAAFSEDSNLHSDQEQSIRKLSSAKLYEITSSPEFLPRIGSLDDPEESLHLSDQELGPPEIAEREEDRNVTSNIDGRLRGMHEKGSSEYPDGRAILNRDGGGANVSPQCKAHAHPHRPHSASRNFSTPPLRRRTSSKALGSTRISIHRSITNNVRSSPTSVPPQRLNPALQNHMVEPPIPSPMPSTVPAPPRSLSTYLELELSSKPPPPFYIHRSIANDLPYESSRVKLERLQNFLLLPPQLEQVLWFGALACLDAWLYSFTLLPLRFLKALSLLARSWMVNLAREIRSLTSFVYSGLGRVLRRRRKSSVTTHDVGFGSSKDGQPQEHGKSRKTANFAFTSKDAIREEPRTPRSRRGSNAYRHHRRTKSSPSTLSENHKADILKGLLIIISCIILMHFDASRMYHGIRGQAAIKLYVIYNVLEVCDRLFSAIGQDVLECLFSKEALERKPDGRSKVLRPFGLFVLALFYNLVHATALFYQVITLNVAVNSYSNALLTLLMSNQFVEIKSTVFKKFEKDNLFQITCADVVERFQLWLMLTIIAARNIIETGGLSLNNSNSTSAAPLQSSSILPSSFTLFPVWTGQVMGPFLLVLGSEMLVDWIKHAYITKFNLTKPAIYGRFLDVLAKDYYTNAFADQNLTRRLGLPVIPLSCLFIRASVQTYHMFLATHMPLPIPSTATSLSVDEATTSPATTAALQHIDQIFRRALGRSTFGGGGGGSPTLAPTASWLNTDDLIAFTTMVLFFLVLYLVLLALKLVLGMCLLSFARRRYIGMKERERENGVDAEGKRVGGWGVVEVDEAKRSWIYVDDREGLEKLRERDRKKGKEDDSGFAGVSRYSMVAKRIW